MPFAPGTLIGSCEIVSLLGAGGMGQVYLARETQLERRVAVKVLLPDVAADPERLARFRREAQLLATLNHPNIAQIHGLVESNGVTALVLEYVEGVTLADVIDDGLLPVSEVTDIARQLAEALRTAHGTGIIHRDLKPANIKRRPDGVVKLLDFGLAKTIEPRVEGHQLSNVSTQLAGDHLTSIGTVVGTTPYMSPQQLRGLGATAASDVWAFGCVLYELLCLQRAFPGQTRADIVAAILRTRPDWRRLPRRLPRRLTTLVKACLELDEAMRPASFDEIAATLRPPSRPASTQAGTAPGGATPRHRAKPPDAVPDPVSILIGVTAGQVDADAARGVEAFLKSSLEQAAFITCFKPGLFGADLEADDPEALLRLAARQGVAYVLLPRVSRAGHVTLSLQLMRAITGQVVLSETVTGESLPQVVKGLSRPVAGIRRVLGEQGDSDRMYARMDVSARSMEAVQAWAAALDAMTRGDFERARQRAKEAVHVDPAFGAAYTVLAAAELSAANVEGARAAMAQAIRLLDSMTERERLSTRVMFCHLQGDLTQGASESRELIRRFSGDVMGYNQLALFLDRLRQFGEAVSVQERAVQILPERSLFRINLSLYAAHAGDWERSEKHAQAVIERGDIAWGRFALARAASGRGDLAGADRLLQQLGEASSVWHARAAQCRADLYVYEGRYSAALDVLAAEAANVIRGDLFVGEPLQLRAVAEAALGRHDAAVDTACDVLAAADVEPAHRVAAAGLLLELGRPEYAERLAGTLVSDLRDEWAAYGFVLQGRIAAANGSLRDAVTCFGNASKIIDLWEAQFALGEAYLRARQFVQADAAFERCLRRRGELLRIGRLCYIPVVYLRQGEARRGLDTSAFAECYRTYLSIREAAGEDPLLETVRERAREN